MNEATIKKGLPLGEFRPAPDFAPEDSLRLAAPTLLVEVKP